MRTCLHNAYGSVTLQPAEGSGTAGSSHLQGFELVEGLVEPSGKMSLLFGNLLKGPLVG